MNITFMIGNGFDLAIGLKTKYTDFYSWYCLQPSKTSVIKDFKNDILLNIAQKSDKWSDFESGLCEYTKKFSIANIQKFYECYDDAQSALVDYLLTEEAHIEYSSRNSEIITVFKKSLLTFYHELNTEDRNVFTEFFNLHNAEFHIYNFIIFNYTQTFDQCIKLVSDAGPMNIRNLGHNGSYHSKIGQTVHIHGYTNNMPIIGANDTDQIGNSSLCQDELFCATMIKPTSVRQLGEGWDQQANALISNSDIVCIFGMSLGNTDLKWWQQLGTWLKKDKNHRLIFFSFGNPLSNISLRSKLKNISQIKTHFANQSGLNEIEHQDILKQIFIIHNTRKVFNLQLALDVPPVLPNTINEAQLVSTTST